MFINANRSCVNKSIGVVVNYVVENIKNNNRIVVLRDDKNVRIFHAVFQTEDQIEANLEKYEVIYLNCNNRQEIFKEKQLLEIFQEKVKFAKELDNFLLLAKRIIANREIPHKQYLAITKE